MTSGPSAAKPATPGDGGGLSQLEGTLERVTFHNPENGYTVARLSPRGKGYVVTVVGTMYEPAVGASLLLRGRWTSHAQYGKQLEFVDYREQLPATVEGLRRYLGSGLIKGVGPVTAEHIVDHFGLETLEIIDRQPQRLREVPGVGDVRADTIARAWEEQRQIKEVMIFLQAHGVSTSLAVRIYKTYGDESVAVVKGDPYRLAREVFGIGFLTADKIAQQMGLEPDSPKRLEAGLLYALEQKANEGHSYAPRPELIAAAAGLLQVPEERLTSAVDRLAAADAVIVERLDKIGVDAQHDTAVRADSAELFEDDPARQAIYLPPFFYAEVGVANRLRRMLQLPDSRLGAFRSLDWQTTLDWMDRRLPQPLAARQREAVRLALTEKVSVLTGGPGTGKTTTVRAIIDTAAARGAKVLLAAPTGRAAKRLAETTGMEAKTLHRLLEFAPAEGRLFKRDAENPLVADLLVVDEVSMVDILMANHLTKALDPATHLLLVGDVDQLPSVGAGNVLRDLIDSGVVPTVQLDEIFRQAADSHIVTNAHRINQGQSPIIDPQSRDFFLFGVEEAEQAADWVVDVVARRIPRRWPQYVPARDVQVLSPMHRGPAGVAALNERLQATLNPPAADRPEVRFGGRVYRLGDKVMQIRNNYDKDAFNGDVGRIVAIDAVEQTLEIDLDGTPVTYEFGELDELVLAYACSTHKSQGSEYPVVVMTLLPAHSMMLQRNLLYTGVTRARELCVLVGSRRAIARAVKNDRIAERHSGLRRRLQP
ncbi:MAG: ATP-dependent RecD-like DNA helicase [Chloroflexi bacterium]|nr:ATP-dependent RecD-like DNA helicase [Chloroflexota bacterium]